MKGLGNDIIEVRRIQRLIDLYGQKFLDKIFTSEEQGYCLSYKESGARFAGRFAAKEAVAKALGTGFRDEVTWKGIAILPGKDGRPSLQLSEEINSRFGNPQILLSISHCKEYATAVAVWLVS